MRFLLSGVGIALTAGLFANAMRLPPATVTITTRLGPETTEKAILAKRGNWVEVCPTSGDTLGCKVIAVDQILSEPNGGHYVPECDANGSCHYIGYAEPTGYTITGATSYELTSAAGGDIFSVPLPIPLPPPELLPVPIPPPEPPVDIPDAPEDPNLSLDFSQPPATTTPAPATTPSPTITTPPTSACELVSSRTLLSTITLFAAMNDDWLESVTSEYGSTLSYFYDWDASPTASPTCLADGAPWLSPTSFCDCGTSATYPTLPAVAGQTTANCACTVLPASQITPVSTAAAPTDIPGEGGLPGCAAVIYPDGQACPNANYCNCGGTAAPLLTTTISGTSTTNCDYTIQPTANSCPTPTTTTVPSPVIPPTTTTPTLPPPSPTVGFLACVDQSETSGCSGIGDVHSWSVDATADYMQQQFPYPVAFTSASANFTRTYMDSGVTYMMTFAWIPGCTKYASQRPDRPLDPTVEYNWEGILKDCYYNCTGNAGLGGHVDVGCLRYSFFPNQVNGVFGTSGPANPSLFWNTMHYC